MNEKALHTLEYDKIIEKLVGYAVSPMAKERAAALRPSAAMSDIIIWQEETTEATTMVLKKGTPSFGGFREIRPQLKRASMAGILSIAELMSVGEFVGGTFQVAMASGKVQQFLVCLEVNVLQADADGVSLGVSFFARLPFTVLPQTEGRGEYS